MTGVEWSGAAPNDWPDGAGKGGGPSNGSGRGGGTGTGGGSAALF